MFNNIDQSGPPMNSTTHRNNSTMRKYIADLGSPIHGVTTGMQTGDETQFAFTNLDTNYDSKQKMVLAATKRSNPTFAERVGSVTHLPEGEHDAQDKKGKYFKTARGTAPNTSIDEKKTQMFLDKVEASMSGQFDNLQIGPARTSNNFNADIKSKEREKAWNAVVLPSITEKT